MSEPTSPHIPPTVQSSFISTDVDLSGSATAQPSRPSTPGPEMPSKMTVPRLKTPPPGEGNTPKSHRRNRHAPVVGPVFGPLVSTSHGVMPLSPLAVKEGSRALVLPRGSVDRLGTIGEVGAEAEGEEWQKKAEEEKEKYGVKKIQFGDDHSKPEIKEKK